MKTFFFFFGEHLRLCPWSLALASSIPVLGLESVCPRKGCPWPWPRIFFVFLALASSLVSSTPPLIKIQGLVIHLSLVLDLLISENLHDKLLLLCELFLPIERPFVKIARCFDFIIIIIIMQVYRLQLDLVKAGLSL